MKKNILISGIYYEGGGLGNVMHNLVRHLSKEFNITCIAFVPGNGNHQQKLSRCKEQVYNIPYRGNRFSISEKDEVYHQIKNNQFETILMLGPIHLNAWLI